MRAEVGEHADLRAPARRRAPRRATAAQRHQRAGLGGRHRAGTRRRDVAPRSRGARSSACPAIIRAVASGSASAARAAGRPASSSSDLHGQRGEGVADDDRRAGPNTAHTVGRWRRSRSSSMRSSWSSEKLCDQLDRHRAGDADLLVGAGGGRPTAGRAPARTPCRRRSRPGGRRRRPSRGGTRRGAAVAWRQPAAPPSAWPAGCAARVRPRIGRRPIAVTPALRP